MTTAAALILCPQGTSTYNTQSKLLGLTIGERILLTLSHNSVRKVSFIGPGPRPACARADLEIIEPGEMRFENSTDSFLLLSADTVFHKNILENPGADLSAPVALLSASEWPEIISDPDTWIEQSKQESAICEPDNRFALRVRDKASFKRAGKLLLLSLRKPIDGRVSRHINRSISILFTRLVVDWGVTPNQITLSVLLVGIVAAALVSLGQPWWILVLAGVLLQVQSILDGSDGEIARLTFRFSKAGQWLDTLGDDLTNYLFYAGLGIGLWRTTGNSWYLYLGAVTFAAQWITSGMFYRRMIILGTGDLLAVPDTFASDTPVEPTLFNRTIDVVRLLGKRDSFLFIISVFTVAQVPLLGFLLMTAGTYPWLVGVIVNERRLNRAS